jgi:hypothetical protein
MILGGQRRWSGRYGSKQSPGWWSGCGWRYSVHDARLFSTPHPERFCPPTVNRTSWTVTAQGSSAGRSARRVRERARRGVSPEDEGNALQTTIDDYAEQHRQVT